MPLIVKLDATVAPGAGDEIATSLAATVIEATDGAGAPLRFEVESKLAAPIHIGGGYGGDCFIKKYYDEYGDVQITKVCY